MARRPHRFRVGTSDGWWEKEGPSSRTELGRPKPRTTGTDKTCLTKLCDSSARAVGSAASGGWDDADRPRETPGKENQTLTCPPPGGERASWAG